MGDGGGGERNRVRVDPGRGASREPEQRGGEARTRPRQARSYPVPIIQHLVAVPLPALAHSQRASAAKRAVAKHPVVVLLALGSGYQQADGSGLVKTLQRGLARVGDRPGAIDGRYGPLTTKAVIRFQTTQGLRVDGTAGPQTLTRLRVVLGRLPRPVHAGPSTTAAPTIAPQHPAVTTIAPEHPAVTTLAPQHPAVTTTHPRPVATAPASSDWHVLWFVLAGLAVGLTVLAARRPRVRPRRRRHINSRTLPIARLAGFRYCKQREAYVLRLVGDRSDPS